MSERYNLTIERVKMILEEESVEKIYLDYFRNVSRFILKVNEVWERVSVHPIYGYTLDELRIENQALYQDVLEENYDTSYANPAYASKVFGKEIGEILCFLYSEIRAEIGYAFEKKGIDTLKIARVVHKDMESKSLGALCEHYQIINHAAHRAYYDALATAKLYQTLAHYFEEKEPKVFVPEELNYKPKKVQPITGKQIEFLTSLCKQYQIQLEQPVESFTRSEASRKIDEILSTHGYQK